MIGMMSSYTENGFYYNVEKIINIPKGLITGIGVVMMPRMSRNISVGNKSVNDIYIRKFVYIVMFTSCALAFGMSAVAQEFVPWFFGDGYVGCIALMRTMAFALIFMSLADTVRMQYLIPNNKETVYAGALFVSAIFNVLINAILIPKHGALGAVIGTLVAECVAFMMQFYVTARNIKILTDFAKALWFAIDGCIMWGIIRAISVGFDIKSMFIKLLLEIGIGGISYVILGAIMMQLINPMLMNDILNMFQIKPMKAD
jgi:O-antigen/teichoic acid export membrane protein